MTTGPLTPESLVFNWGDAYMFFYSRDRWVAMRRDDHAILATDTLAELEAQIESDYADKPVPRNSGPPGETDCLAPQEEEQDEGDAPGEDTLIILRELRKLFPLWDITYAREMRTWIAKSRKTIICEDSAAFFCIALTRAERHRRPPHRSS
jgi:hypothetical protein